MVDFSSPADLNCQGHFRGWFYGPDDPTIIVIAQKETAVVKLIFAFCDLSHAK